MVLLTQEVISTLAPEMGRVILWAVDVEGRADELERIAEDAAVLFVAGHKRRYLPTDDPASTRFEKVGKAFRRKERLSTFADRFDLLRRRTEATLQERNHVVRRVWWISFKDGSLNTYGVPRGSAKAKEEDEKEEAKGPAHNETWRGDPRRKSALGL